MDLYSVPAVATHVGVDIYHISHHPYHRTSLCRMEGQINTAMKYPVRDIFAISPRGKLIFPAHPLDQEEVIDQVDNYLNQIRATWNGVSQAMRKQACWIRISVNGTQLASEAVYSETTYTEADEVLCSYAEDPDPISNSHKKAKEIILAQYWIYGCREFQISIVVQK
jgi:hypothetical protein